MTLLGLGFTSLPVTRRRGRVATPTPGTLTGTAVRNADGSVSLPSGSSWKGIHGSSMNRVNGLAMLARYQPGDVQAGSAGVANAPYVAGFFPAAAPADPLAVGNALSIANNDTFAGQLGVLGQAHGQAARSVKQVWQAAVVICRDRGAVCYASGPPGARAYGSWPNMRPVALDATRTDASLVPGVYARSTTGTTRVEEFGAKVLSEYPNWYLTAHVADTLLGSGALLGTPAETGGTWAGTGSYVRTATGAQRTGASGANIDPGTASGLIAAEFTFTTATSGHELQFARVDGSNYSYVRLDATGIAFVQVVGGVGNVLQTAVIPSVANRTVRMQVQIQGQVVQCLVDGVVPSGIAPVTYPTAFAATRVGFYINDLNGPTRVTRFEAHPASVPVPASLRVKDPFLPRATTSTLTDPFDGTGALPAPWARTRGLATASRSGGSVSAGTITGDDTHYTQPLAASYADLRLNYTSPPATSNPDTTALRATLVVEGQGPLLASETVAVRSFIDPSQPGNSELEVMGYASSTNYAITNRVAMALEITKGTAQSIRFVVGDGYYIGYFGIEPVITGRTAVGIERVGIGWGASDSGTTIQTFEART